MNPQKHSQSQQETITLQNRIQSLEASLKLAIRDAEAGNRAKTEFEKRL